MLGRLHPRSLLAILAATALAGCGSSNSSGGPVFGSGGNKSSTLPASSSASGQPTKAFDASAKELARTAQTAAETLATDNNGSYATITPAALVGIEPTIQTAAGNNNAWLRAAKGTATGYTVTAVAVSGNTYSITRAASGTISRTCVAQTAGDAQSACVNGAW